MTEQISETAPMNPMRVAIINVHWQRDIATSKGAFGPFFAESVKRGGCVSNARRAIDAVRAAGGMVVYARVAFRTGYPELVQNNALYRQVAAAEALLEGSEGAQIIPELSPDPADPIVTHTRLSAFQGTELDLMLRNRGVDTVLLTGVATDVTVSGTAKDAVGLGYRTILLADACAAATDAAHAAVLDTFQILGETLDTAELTGTFTGHSFDIASRTA
ncbi:cysteine hydrolase [Rhodococcus sp. T2V]|uniref:cysteine hydrolase family protein n=1 Tax=Rhodococcus sp. T2V TaxID=3034164 RepID=UPI0023E12697|nr:isochorismatase family cysteine hydrolase [Rhodococcus sp. T2V]MDF3310570.1 cysteine hydrolase [Rhodococcus sp. T2V]